MGIDYRDREEMAQEREREERRYRSWDRAYEPSYRCPECDVYVSNEDALCDRCKERQARCVECGEVVADECSMCLECAAQSAVAREEAARDRAADEAINAKREDV